MGWLSLSRGAAVPHSQIAQKKALEETVQPLVQQVAQMREYAQSTNDAILREVLSETADESEAAARNPANGFGGTRENLHPANACE